MQAKTATTIAAPAAKAGSKATGASGGCRASSGASSALRSARPGGAFCDGERACGGQGRRFESPPTAVGRLGERRVGRLGDLVGRRGFGVQGDGIRRVRLI